MPYVLRLPPASSLEFPRAGSPIPEKPVIAVMDGDSPSPNTVDSAGRVEPPKRANQTDPAPWDLLTHPPEPRERLIVYLEAWACMNEAEWPKPNVRALYEDIMDIFWKHPEADGWFRDWRAAHPEARLG